MKRTSLLYTVALAYLVGAGPATAQSLGDIVKESEGGRMPSQAEWQQRRPATPENGPALVPPRVELVPAEPLPPTMSLESTSPTPTACMPPGMPALSELVTVGRHAMVAPVDGSDDTVMVSAIGLVTKDHLGRYFGGELPLDFIVYYVRGNLAAVDDHPGDPSEPDIVDIGMVSPSGAALAQGTPVCQWARLSRVPGAGRTTTPNNWI